LKVEVKESDLCPRYAGRAMTNVKVAPSPEWLKKRLEGIGVKSINNIVDVTNYVMHELGQPLHAFDVSQIKGGKITVAKATAGETFITLDGSEKVLKGEELTIRDQERPVALAGIVGGKNSGIQSSTQNIFIEAAYFLSSHVRKNSRALNIETDSAYRFSRGVNPEAVPLAMNRAAQLIQQLAGGEICSQPYDIYPNAIVRKPILISLDLLESRLGYKVDSSEFVNWMKRLGCQISDGTTENHWNVFPPAFRTDMNIDMDLVEEFARLHGYQHIPETLPSLHYSPTPDAIAFQNEKRLRKILVELGYHQEIHYAFTSAKWQKHLLGATSKLAAFGMKASDDVVTLMNPLNEEIGVMRTSLLPGLIKNIAHNFNNTVLHGRIFEIGVAHFHAAPENSQIKYEQETHMAVAIWGAEFNLWKKIQNIPIALELKASLTSLLKKLQIHRWNLEAAKAAPDFLHPKQAAFIMVEGKPIGFIGSLHPNLLDELKIRTPVAVIELNVEKLMLGQPRLLKYAPISRQPFVDRDLSFVMPKDLPAAQVEAVIKQNAGPLLKEIKIVDVFTGGNLKENEQSVSFRLLFQDSSLSLEDAQVNEVRDKIVAAISQKFQIGLR
jgi:phenylalanyl-tRNA synthetase beta chain